MKEIFTVDDTLCIRCGACVDTCPVKLITLEKPDTPKPVVWARKACINCGHCVAVCPKGALSLVTMPADECTPVMKELYVSWEQADQFLRSRRSIRTYLEKPVEKEKIERVIRTARYAPTGHNSQGVSWTVIYDATRIDILKRLVIEWMRMSVEENATIATALKMKSVLMGWDAGNDIILRGAPHVIVAHAHKDDRMSRTSCLLALSYLDLAANTLGLGACWAGFLDLTASHYPPVLEALGLPPDHVDMGSMMIGYPKHRFYRIPLRKEPPIVWK